MPDSVARGLRTVLQGELLQAFLLLLDSFGVPISTEQHQAIQAFIVALGVFVTAYNALEDNVAAMPTLLKPSPPAENPVAPPADGG